MFWVAESSVFPSAYTDWQVMTFKWDKNTEGVNSVPEKCQGWIYEIIPHWNS